MNPQDHWCDLSPDALLCLDEQWRVLFFNRATDAMFQAGDKLAIGQPPWQCAPLLAILEELHLDTLAPDSEHRSVRRVELSRAGLPPFEVAVAVGGQTSNRIFTVSIRDVSRLSPTSQSLYQSQRRQLVGSLAGGIAHDFNNILTAVISYIDLVLMDKELAPKAREFLNQALKGARRGAELNSKLLQFSRHTESRPAAVGLARLVEETAFLLRRSIDRRIRVQFDLPNEELWTAWVDEGQFMQVLMNLSLNARDAMPKGGELTFHLANRKFAPGERPPRHPGEFVQVSVHDTGHGMSPEVLGRLFEPYFTTKEFGKGAGLGLSIANHVVVESGGWMEVESEPGSGSRFHVYLPRAAAQAPSPAAPAAPAAAVGAALEGYETVLLVDDEHSVREVVQAMLTFRGYQVVEAADGTEALERFRSASATINLVLLDIQMPRMNGWDTMEKIHELSPRMPVLLLSGGDSDPPGDGSALSRAAGVLKKPFASPDLLRAVRRALDQARSAG